MTKFALLPVASRLAGLVVLLIGLGGCATLAPPAPRTALSDDGLAEITAPSTWQTRPNIGRSASIRLVNLAQDGYLLVTSYLPGETRPMTLDAFSDLTGGALVKNLADGRMGAPRALTIGGRPAIEREVSGLIGDTRFTYLSTVIEGERARYHLTGWSFAHRYPSLRDELRQIAISFRESATRRPERARIDLLFRWPVSARSLATFETRASRRGETMTLQGEVVTTVHAAGENELLVKTRVTKQKTAFDGKRGGAGKEAYLQQVLAAALSDIPDYVVDHDGEFVRVENLPAYHQRIQAALLKGLPPGSPEMLARARGALQSMMSEETLTLLLQDEWNNTVGHWAGGSYVTGETYSFRLPYQSPALGEGDFLMTMTQQLTGRVPCRAGAPARGCVRLLLQSRVDGDDYTAAVNRLVRRTLGTAATVTDTSIDTRFEIITDPKTLLPYQTHKKQVKRVTVRVAGQSQTTEDVQETRATYQY